MLDLHSTTQVVSMLHATVLGKNCSVNRSLDVVTRIGAIRKFVHGEIVEISGRFAIRDMRVKKVLIAS